jgi:uncharacterized protein (TIGR00297 family)
MSSGNPTSEPALQGRLLTKQQTIQLSLLTLAFLLPAFTWIVAAGAAALMLLFTAVTVPQLERGRAGSPSASGSLVATLTVGGAAGRLVFYSLLLLFLTLVYRHDPQVVAATWALMALGDTWAAVAGTAVGRTPLPWNPRKTWAGFAAFVLAGSGGAYVLLRWLDPVLTEWRALLLGALTALVGAGVESTSIELDDNVTVPLVCGGFLFCVSFVQSSAFDSNLPYLPRRLFLALAVNAIFAAIAFSFKAASRSGTGLGFVLGVLVYLGWGWKSFLVLFAFFVLASAATRLGYARKAARGVAELRGGARSWREALANVGPGAFFAILVIITHLQGAFLVAFVAAFAETAGDTVSSEIGKWLSPRAYLISTWRPVTAGENGGLSVAGTVAGFAASALVAGLAFALGLATFRGALLALVAAVAGNLFDSLLGATLEQRGLITNCAVNFAGTSFAGALALAVALR